MVFPASLDSYLAACGQNLTKMFDNIESRKQTGGCGGSNPNDAVFRWIRLGESGCPAIRAALSIAFRV